MQAAQDTAYLSVNEDYKNRRVEDIHALIDAGADVNAKTESGETALAAAIREYIPKKSDGAIRALLDAKADPNIADSKGRTPLMLLAAQCNWDCAHDAIAALLVRADINLRDQDGATALMLAVKGNQQYNVNTLLGAHADPNLPDKDGKTPLWWANNPRAYPFSPGKNPVVIRALSDAGAQ
jgi:ankyrin repeat protein